MGAHAASGKRRNTEETQMAYKDILIYLDPSPGAEDRLSLAAELAQAHMARLIGVDASSNEAFLGDSAERAIQIGDRFAEATRAAGIESQLVAADDGKGDHFPDYSHCVDLAIAPRPEGDAKKLVRSFIPDQLVMNSGGPVLILPQYWKFGPVGQNIVVAWNASREATRAVHDSMPLLQKAHKVTLFAFSSARSGLRASIDLLREHLGRHDVTAHVSDWTDTGDISAVEALFADLDTQDADLIVAGAFGHSRLFEALFGGVTLELLRQPSLPLLLSH
jgi:nucleotide-binding universal stress UspA family protein